MEADLLGSLATGDSGPEVPVTQPLKREQDSVDDFEHLEREGKREESPFHHPAAARTATQGFLDTEREELFVDTPRAPSATDKLSDHLADKFTDSESEVSASESPLHRPEPPPHARPGAPTPEPASLLDTTPFHDTLPADPIKPDPIPEVKPEPKPAPAVEIKPPVPEHAPAKPAPAPAPAKEPAPQPKPAAKEPEAPRTAPVAHVIEAEVIFCQMGLVESLIYWRDPARSGAALGAGLALLVALACCSVVSVLAYVSLLALSAAVGFRIYKNVLQAVQKTNEGHPFKWLLEKEVSVPAERAQELAAGATAHLNATVSELRRLFLVEDLVDSLKFGVLLWCLTYVGACFNGITLIILGWIALFTLPKAYEMNKSQVDANLELARAKINEITAKVRAAVPIGRKAESEKDK
ncbi:hypothetical protein JYU34_009092 [Plutella xylostella]|uniref:Reticulon-like protein n=1 Tax=Plutella xylostella TaxID=51655 RepID=A0ABQ7QMM1_PLUXY|nr:hypothetical protein JYU34_009092 [Plutella xylostella]